VTGAVTDRVIRDLTISGLDFGPFAVTAQAIAPNAVTAPALANNSVGPAALGPNSVNTNNIINHAVLTDQLGFGSVTDVMLSFAAVTPPKIANNAVTPPAIAPSAVGSTALANNAVTPPAIAPNAVGNTALANNAVLAFNVNSGAIGTREISNAIPSASAAKTTNTARTNGAFSALPFPTETFDSANLHGAPANDALMRAPVAGIYQITGTVTWANDGCAGTRSLEVNGFRANGTTPFLPNPHISSTVPASANSTTTQTLTGMIQLGAGETAYIIGGASGMPSCASTNILGNPGASLTMTWIAPGP
jgi:hypothetical protein